MYNKTNNKHVLERASHYVHELLPILAHITTAHKMLLIFPDITIPHEMLIMFYISLAH
jgi:hypothetical protein